MTKRKSLIATFAFVFVLLPALLFGITNSNVTLTAQGEDSTSTDSEIPTYKVYLRWGTLQADGMTSVGTSRGYAQLDVKEGSEVTITAEEKSDAVFVKWVVSGDVDIVFANANSATTTLVMPKQQVWLECEYKLVRSVTVENGTLEGGASSGNCTEGDTVKITAVAAPEGKEFDKWVVVSGEVTFADANSATTTFVMPSGAVEIKATYKDKTPSGGDPDTDDPNGGVTPTDNKGLNGGAIAGIVVGSVAVVGVGGFAVVWFAVKKKSFAELIAAIKGLFKKK